MLIKTAILTIIICFSFIFGGFIAVYKNGIHIHYEAPRYTYLRQIGPKRRRENIKQTKTKEMIE